MVKQSIPARQLSQEELNVFSSKTGLSTIPDLAWEKVLRPEDLEDYYFYVPSAIPRTIMEVNLDLLVGTVHNKYNQSSWVDMIINLHKSTINNYSKANEAFDYPYGELPEYFKFGNLFFIAGQGNHRTSIAKIGGRKWVKAWVIDYVLDNELKEFISYLDKYFDFVEDDEFKSKSYFQLRSDTVWISGNRLEIVAFYRYFKTLQVEEGKVNLVDRISSFLRFRYPQWNEDLQNLRWKECMGNDSKIRQSLLALKFH